MHALTVITHMWHQALDNQMSTRRYSSNIARHLTTLTMQQCYQKWLHLKLTQYLRWMHSFLSNRQQRVKIGFTVSQWTTLNGGMPQGTCFGPYVFLMLIRRFVHNARYLQIRGWWRTLKLLLAHQSSDAGGGGMSNVSWSNQILMNINTKKTKEMLLGSIW